MRKPSPNGLAASIFATSSAGIGSPVPWCRAKFASTSGQVDHISFT